jgi:hypothetical protein
MDDVASVTTLALKSGDGTIAHLSLAGWKELGQSDNMEDELLSCCVAGAAHSSTSHLNLSPCITGTTQHIPRKCPHLA